MKNTFKRGFTLIELLVVIAIIGILASVVLASLNTAQDKGASAAIKSDINSARAQAELFYDTANTYNGMCGDTKITQIGAAVDAETGASTWTCTESDTNQAWVIYSQMVGTTDVFCADSTGKAKVLTAAPTVVTSADSTTDCE